MTRTYDYVETETSFYEIYAASTRGCAWWKFAERLWLIRYDKHKNGLADARSRENISSYDRITRARGGADYFSERLENLREELREILEDETVISRTIPSSTPSDRPGWRWWVEECKQIQLSRAA